MKDEVMIKIKFVEGLGAFVKKELMRLNIPEYKIESEVFITIPYDWGIVEILRTAGTISNVYIMKQGARFNPSYIMKHKSIVGELIERVLANNMTEKFKSFRISCAGNDSMEVRSIKKYISQTFSMIESEKADLRIYIIKINDMWEIGVEATSRPLSVRDYKVDNMSGAMDPTIASALCSLFRAGDNISVLNPCSGSGTLLIEAIKLHGSRISKCVGFDNNKEHITISKHNIKKAGLIKNIDIKLGDMLEKIEIGKFDVIISDLPFGMTIGKGSDLPKLYTAFFDCVDLNLKQGGEVLVFTVQFELFESISKKYGYKFEKYPCKIVSNDGAYLYLSIYKCLKSARY